MDNIFGIAFLLREKWVNSVSTFLLALLHAKSILNIILILFK